MRQVELLKLHAGQYPVAESIRDQKRVVIRCGRRWGKTSLFERTACKRAFNGQRVGWFSPTYKLNMPTYRRVLHTLRPRVQSASKIDQLIELDSGGAIEFWTLQDEDAGRSRFYDLVIIDEASLVKQRLREIWEQSIAPTLLDRRGSAIMGGTPKGIDPDNYFYEACTDKSLGWVEHHAPTSGNPALDSEAVAKLKDEYPPLVYQQEYLAEFVDWNGAAFFAESNLLVDGLPVEQTTPVDMVYAIVDTAMKDGVEHDGTAVTYFGRNRISGYPLIVLDWDVIQIRSDLLSDWLPSVHRRMEELSKQYRSRRGWSGPWIEDKASGITLLQHAEKTGMPAHALPTALTAMGKDGRALNVSGYVYQGQVKMTKAAYDKTQQYRGQTRNHLISQVCGFRVGEKNAHQMDLLDCFTYGIAIGLGNSDGY